MNTSATRLPAADHRARTAGSIALIGPDGAGKTTVTRRLEASRILPFRYMYMGVDVSASNVALPTSRLAERLKRRGGNSSAQRAGSEVGVRVGGSARRGGAVRSGLRLMNRIAEECYRQFVSWVWQRRGFVVLYDRHYLFDFAPEIQEGSPDTLERRLHRAFLRRFYPRPDKVVFLDAPGEVLYARKGESTPSELERRRQAFLRIGTSIPNFHCVDATQPLDDVVAEITAHITGRGNQGPPAWVVP